MQEFYRVQGNEQATEAAQRAVERCRKGLVRSIAIIFCEGNSSDILMAGDERASMAVNMGADMLKHVVMQQTVNVHDMKSPKETPANRVCYDLKVMPICFDFVLWLATCETIRHKEGAPAPLYVGFSGEMRHDHDGMRSRFMNNVMRPALTLFGAVEDSAVAPVTGRRQGYSVLRDLAQLHAQGAELPRLFIPALTTERMAKTLGGRRPVTITLRETEHQPHRNSHAGHWLRFAHWLRDQGEDVIVVRDTNKAEELFGNIETMPTASRDLLVRAALYAQAKANFFVCNGPWVLALFTAAPWVLFATVEHNEPHEAQRPEFWDQYICPDANGQIAWATPQQRIVYEMDTFENMKRAWDGLWVEPKATAWLEAVG